MPYTESNVNDQQRNAIAMALMNIAQPPPQTADAADAADAADGTATAAGRPPMGQPPMGGMGGAPPMAPPPQGMVPQAPRRPGDAAATAAAGILGDAAMSKPDPPTPPDPYRNRRGADRHQRQYRRRQRVSQQHQPVHADRQSELRRHRQLRVERSVDRPDLQHPALYLDAVADAGRAEDSGSQHQYAYDDRRPPARKARKRLYGLLQQNFNPMAAGPAGGTAAGLQGVGRGRDQRSTLAAQSRPRSATPATSPSPTAPVISAPTASASKMR